MNKIIGEHDELNWNLSFGWHYMYFLDFCGILRNEKPHLYTPWKKDQWWLILHFLLFGKDRGSKSDFIWFLPQLQFGSEMPTLQKCIFIHGMLNSTCCPAEGTRSKASLTKNLQSLRSPWEESPECLLTWCYECYLWLPSSWRKKWDESWSCICIAFLIRLRKHLSGIRNIYKRVWWKWEGKLNSLKPLLVPSMLSSTSGKGKHTFSNMQSHSRTYALMHVQWSINIIILNVLYPAILNPAHLN